MQNTWRNDPTVQAALRYVTGDGPAVDADSVAAKLVDLVEHLDEVAAVDEALADLREVDVDARRADLAAQARAAALGDHDPDHCTPCATAIGYLVDQTARSVAQRDALLGGRRNPDAAEELDRLLTRLEHLEHERAAPTWSDVWSFVAAASAVVARHSPPADSSTS